MLLKSTQALLFQARIGAVWPWPSRLLSKVLWRFVPLAAVILLWHLYLVCGASRSTLAAKYRQTNFNDVSRDSIAALLQNASIAINFTDLGPAHVWRHRSKWRYLGSGYEGRIYIYGNQAIKTFKYGNSPFRNCLPGTAAKIRWPTEIPASLLLGGKLSLTNRMMLNSKFVPVLDFFLSPDSGDSLGEWHIVYPYFESGNLAQLATRIQKRNMTFRDIDRLFRPSLDNLLEALDIMHTKHNICHDDIKLENLLVTNPINSTEDTSWLIADLGNVRQPSHPYHLSSLWTDNDQIADCRINDATRLLKTYLSFLRQASLNLSSKKAYSSSLEVFDAAFYGCQEPWSRLYWSVNLDSTTKTATASHILKHSIINNAYISEGEMNGRCHITKPIDSRWRILNFLQGDQSSARELTKGMTLSEQNVRKFSFGVPESPC
jgi:serine/threonine protein kinase